MRTCDKVQQRKCSNQLTGCKQATCFTALCKSFYSKVKPKVSTPKLSVINPITDKNDGNRTNDNPGWIKKLELSFNSHNTEETKRKLKSKGNNIYVLLKLYFRRSKIYSTQLKHKRKPSFRKDSRNTHKTFLILIYNHLLSC